MSLCPAGKAEQTKLSHCSQDGELPASLGGPLVSRKGEIAGVKHFFDAELSKHGPCVELGCVCSPQCQDSLPRG